MKQRALRVKLSTAITVMLLFTLSSVIISKAEENPQADKRAQAIGPDNPDSTIYLGADGKPAGRGIPDQPASEVVRIGKGIHPRALSLPGLPKDKFGLINWTEMVKQGIIKPIDSLQPDAPKPSMFDLDILITAKSDFVNNVVFRHAPHVYWLDCNSCHPGIFVMAKGQTNMNMQGIVQGKWCGRCHGKVSFPLTDCKRCHSEPKQ